MHLAEERILVAEAQGGFRKKEDVETSWWCWCCWDRSRLCVKRGMFASFIDIMLKKALQSGPREVVWFPPVKIIANTLTSRSMTRLWGAHMGIHTCYHCCDTQKCTKLFDDFKEALNWVKAPSSQGGGYHQWYKAALHQHRWWATQI